MRKIKKSIIFLVVIALSSMMGSIGAAEEKDAQSAGMQQIKSYKQLIKILEDNKYISANEGEYDQKYQEEGAAQLDEHYGETEIQTEGIDEAALVQTDERYLYSCVGGRGVFIVDTKNKMKQVGHIAYEEEYEEDDEDVYYEYYKYYGDSEKPHWYSPIGLYLDGDRLTVFTEGVQKIKIKNKDYSSLMSGMEIYDISNKENPKLIRKVRVEGKLLHTKRVGKVIYLITKDRMACYLSGKFEEAEVLPGYCDSVSSNEGHNIDVKNMRYSKDIMPGAYTIITRIDTAKKEKPAFDVALIDAEYMYMNKESLYLADVHYPCEYNYQKEWDKSVVMKYTMTGKQVKYINCASVEGVICSNFAMNEYQGKLRIATISGEEQTVLSNIYIFNEKLDRIGSLEGMTKDQIIFRVRFEKDKAYVVTAQYFSSSLVIDLSVPSVPKMAGEEKNQGYSNYIKPAGNHSLIGIGPSTMVCADRYEDGTEVVTQVREVGVKVGLFENKTSNNLSEADHFLLTYDGFSEAAEDPSALVIDDKKQRIAFPVEFWGKGTLSQILDKDKELDDMEYEGHFQGAYVLGIEKHKLVKKVLIFPCDEEGEYTDEYIYQARICFTKDALYYVYDENINVYDKDTLALKQVITLQK